MANEFIARKGLIVLENGVKVTGSSAIFGDITASGDVKAVNFRGSGQYLTDIAADSVQWNNVLNKPAVVSSSAQFTDLSAPFTGSFTGSFKGDGSQLTGVASTLSIAGATAGTDTVNLTTDTLTFSGSNNVTATVTDNKVTIGVFGLISSSTQIDHDATTNFVANEHIDHSTVSISTGAGLTGGGDITTTRTLSLDTGSTHFISGSRGTISVSDTTGAAGINLTYNSGTGVLSGELVNSSITINDQAVSLGGSTTVTANTTNALTLGNGLTGTSFNGSTAVTTAVDTGSAHFTAGVKAKLNTDSVVSSSAQITTVLNSADVHSGSYLGSATTTNLPEGTQLYYLDSRVKDKLNTENVISSSGQVDVRQTTGIATIATTGSNTFTGVQTISNTTNSTSFIDGALIVQGGVGIAKDVNISGSLTVTGLLTAVSTSVQYITSSQLNVSDNKIIVNTNDLLRFGGLSIIDSGSSSPTTASILWDSLAHHFIYENLSGSDYNSAIIIAGPKNTGALGSEVGLISGRIPVATGDDHIDTNAASSSIYIDFATKQTFIEAGLYVTGGITSSVGFYGDGSNLSGVVSTLSITGSQGGQNTVNLKTQGLTVAGTNGVEATVSGQTITISGSNATTSAKGVASFNSTNFSVVGGNVTSNNITINGTGVTLGGTRNITLQEVTSQGSTTTDQLTFTNGFTAATILHTASLATGIIGPVTNQVVATIATGSYVAAHFNYVISDGSNLRTGTVMSIWNGGSIEFTDTSTNDIGTTTGANFVVDTSLNNVRLKFSVPSGTWTVKTSIQAL